ncbi:DgyrCDS12865 [Dimorphilus gyrociliatus]|uniref:DgyrCDS12865 n=1 Tax=Dimorphilus gyrociliatus TaxID=2664684 RepID=A0A7I8W8Z8_9ANNE|nr:DgyrCDS12865 [Dimorphilus gyrociliatus]
MLKAIFILALLINLSESYGFCVLKLLTATETNRLITTPNYLSSGYKSNQHICWLITTDNKSQIEIKNVDGYLEYSRNCSKDYGAAYDFYQLNRRRLLWKFCGRSVNGNRIRSTTNKIFIEFKSDGWNSGYKGFKLTYVKYKSSDVKSSSIAAVVVIVIVLCLIIVFAIVTAIVCGFVHHHNRSRRLNATIMPSPQTTPFVFSVPVMNHVVTGRQMNMNNENGVQVAPPLHPQHHNQRPPPYNDQYDYQQVVLPPYDPPQYQAMTAQPSIYQ